MFNTLVGKTKFGGVGGGGSATNDVQSFSFSSPGNVDLSPYSYIARVDIFSVGAGNNGGSGSPGTTTPHSGGAGGNHAVTSTGTTTSATTGGGGAGGYTSTGGTANTGGGAGSGRNQQDNLQGGSGVVIIRYLTSALS